jgi:hypothetical protein
MGIWYNFVGMGGRVLCAGISGKHGWLKPEYERGEQEQSKNSYAAVSSKREFDEHDGISMP